MPDVLLLRLQRSGEPRSVAVYAGVVVMIHVRAQRAHVSFSEGFELRNRARQRMTELLQVR